MRPGAKRPSQSTAARLAEDVFSHDAYPSSVYAQRRLELRAWETLTGHGGGLWEELAPPARGVKRGPTTKGWPASAGCRLPSRFSLQPGLMTRDHSAGRL